MRRALEDRKADRCLMDIRLRERSRAFAIETGQIEDLYRLRRGGTEQLVTEGFEGVRAPTAPAGTSTTTPSEQPVEKSDRHPHRSGRGTGIHPDSGMRGALPTGRWVESLPRFAPPSFAGRGNPPRTPPRRRSAPRRCPVDFRHSLRGLLEDQEETLQIVFDMARGGTPLGNTTIRGLHAILTRHQASAVGIHGVTGERARIPLLKGDYEKRPNDSRRPDGFVHEYCPPEQVDSEMERFLKLHRSHAEREVEAAWLHHAFARIHPFQDGNGRMSRLLVAWAFVRNGEFPPVISAGGKRGYIDMLEIADDGDLRPFIRYLARLALVGTGGAVEPGRPILKGRDRLRHGNDGVTANGRYRPPAQQG